MERLVKGDVVVVQFPFSDLTSSKRRPAVIATCLDGDDVILCQITSKRRNDKYSLELEENDFEIGCLNSSSMIRPNRLFTADMSIISYKIGTLTSSMVKRVEYAITDLFKD